MSRTKCEFSEYLSYVSIYCNIFASNINKFNMSKDLNCIQGIRMNLLRIILTSACLAWTCFIHGTYKIRTLSVEKDSILKTNTYLKDSIKISAMVSKEDAQHVIVRIENHGKKFISIGRIYGLQTFINPICY